MKKLNQLGFTHVTLLAALVVVAGVAFAGYRVLGNSNANTSDGGGATSSSATAVCGKGYKTISQGGTSSSNNLGGMWVVAKNDSQRKLCSFYYSVNKTNGVLKPMTLALRTEKKCSISYSWASKGAVVKAKSKHMVGPIYTGYTKGQCFGTWAEMSVKGTGYSGGGSYTIE